MKSFKQAAKQILAKANKPLHYKVITQQAIKNGLLQSQGKTPWATMSAVLSVDVKNEDSDFYRAGPGLYGLKKTAVVDVTSLRLDISSPKVKVGVSKGNVNSSLNSKQKGDIGEARVAELITLYGSEGLSCYKPISDDEGIDLIVKRRGKLEVAYIQVKTSYGYKDRGFVATVKEKNIVNKARMFLVFIYFDLSEGDLFDQVFCIPAPEFLKLTENKQKKTPDRVFTVGLKHPDRSKYAEFMIEKRELADKLVEYLDKL